VIAKETADHLSGARMVVIEALVFLVALVLAWFSTNTIRESIGESPFLFLRLLTISPDPIPFSFIGMVGLVTPVIAIALGFDAVNAEFNQRTLSRILAQPIYRDALLIGKFIAGLATLGSMLLCLWLLVIGTIPVGVFGLLFNKEAETTWRNPFVIGGMLIAVGVLMWIAENVARKERDLAGISIVDAAAIGAAQALAIVPGTSRSGITITAGLFRNFTREAAARFSFLLSTPAIAAAAAKSLHEMQKSGRLHDVFATDFLLGVAVSALTGLAVIAWFLHYLRRAGLRPFVYYRIIFGIIVIALAFIRRPA